MGQWLRRVAATLAVVLSGMAPVAAQDGLNVIYGGVGLEDDRGALPYAFGFMRLSEVSGMVLGVDISGEGVMLDSTWGADELRQAMSFNAIIGGSISNGDRMRVDAGLLIGMRESFADCPDSYLGYQCYADFPPDTEYEVNVGGILGLSFDSVMLGLRVTDQSAQALAGFRF